MLMYSAVYHCLKTLDGLQLRSANPLAQPSGAVESEAELSRRGVSIATRVPSGLRATALSGKGITQKHDAAATTMGIPSAIEGILHSYLPEPMHHFTLGNINVAREKATSGSTSAPMYDLSRFIISIAPTLG